jgi:endonuclease YncB( thermonuclease family)
MGFAVIGRTWKRVWRAKALTHVVGFLLPQFIKTYHNFMNTFFLLLFLLSIPTLIVAMIKPNLIKLHTRKSVLGIVGGIMISSFILFGITIEDKQNTEPVKEVVASTVETSTTTETKKPVEVIKQINQQATPKTETRANTDYVYYSVVEVVDGDTVKLNINGTTETLRLIGLDTPETVDPRKPVQCFGKEASNKGKELLTGKKVRIEEDPTQGKSDKYNRILAYIYTENGILYNKYMIEQGYAHEYTYNTAYKYQTEFKEAQRLAQQNQLGLWSPNTCNGNTTGTAQSSTVTSTGIKYYTSSASNATKYYPDTCPAWQELSKTNLRTFNSLEELLAVYPKRILADVCK